jgi:iron(III) transport system ATP-binding protein
MIELSVENLHLTYGDNPVLKGVSMTLGRGEVVSLLGPSGSGKTTLLRAVAGLEKPTSGRIAIGNRTVYDGTPRSESRPKSVTWAWSSSPMPCGRTKRCSTTWPIR